ncbi:MAG: hypothetical protein PUC47_11315, partial [Oscillospiraceae bacterium]|nr:hypothetical protein [Oscillospiraceae bacterium]
MEAIMSLIYILLSDIHSPFGFLMFCIDDKKTANVRLFRKGKSLFLNEIPSKSIDRLHKVQQRLWDISPAAAEYLTPPAAAASGRCRRRGRGFSGS